MKPLTLEWVEKAEGDWATAQRELAVTVRPNFGAVCFHVQQCIEKYLKGRLHEGGIGFPKTHDLVDLLNLLTSLEPSWSQWKPDLAVLTAYAVEIRYPGSRPNKKKAEDAVTLCQSIRALVRTSLGLNAASYNGLQR